MARITRPLTNNEILKAKPREKDFTLHDGDGLFLLVKTSGKKLWSFRYQRPGSSSRTNLSLGSYPALTLAAARQIRDQHLTTLAQGMDPQQQQEQASEQRQIELDSIFSTVAANWFQIKSRSVTEDYAKDIWRSLDKDVFPAIGTTPVQEIKARTIVEALEPIKARGALETVRRLVQRVNEIMIYAVNTGLIDANPASDVGMAFEKPKKQNMPTLRPEELPKLMRSLVMSNLSVSTRCLIEWQLLTLVRPSEASGTRWAEIDLDAKLWTIPAERMKAKREHIVPLSPQALEILEVMKPISVHREHVFPSRNDPKQPMNSQTANAALKRIGYGGKLVAHGLRSIASTALNEAEFNADVIEAALAHSDKNEVRKAYNRAIYLKQRIELMNYWGKKYHYLMIKKENKMPDLIFKLISESNGSLHIRFTPPSGGSNSFYLEIIKPFCEINGDEITLKAYQKNTLELKKSVKSTCGIYLQENKALHKLMEIIEKIPSNEFFLVTNKEFTSKDEECSAIIFLNGLNHSPLPEEQQKYIIEKYERYLIPFKATFEKYNLYYFDADNKKSIGEKNKTIRRCRFCFRTQEDGATYKKEAHAISFALGNRNIINYEECDSCNEYFGETIEKNFIEHYDFLRVFHGIKGRKGNVKIKTPSFSMSNENGNIKIYNARSNIDELAQNRISHHTGKTHKHIPERNYQFLCKIALSLLPSSELIHYKETISWVRYNQKSGSLPKIYTALTENHRLSVTLYVEKGLIQNLAHTIVEFNLYGLLFIYPIPFCSLDRCKNTNIVNNPFFLDLFPRYKSMNLNEEDLSSEIEKEVCDDITFIVNDVISPDSSS